MGPRHRHRHTSPRAAARALAVAVSSLLATACPQQVSTGATPSGDAAPGAKGEPKGDPRVVADTDDFYPVRRAGDAAPTPPVTAPPAQVPGRGKPDETNGVCRLFAPDHPEPACCQSDLGFDVQTVHDACGARMYLGESHYGTCGYYFMPEGGGSLDWYRLSYAMGDTVKQATDDHDERLRIRMKLPPDFKSSPVPGVAGAYWSSHNGLHWAFIPGWPRVRQLAWRDEHCDQNGVATIIKQLAGAAPVATGTPRSSLVPRARPRGEGPATPTPTPTPTPKPEPPPPT